MREAEKELCIVLCPYCQSDYSHQGRVEVFLRKEDASYGRYANVAYDFCSDFKGELPNGNPSDRRQGVLVHVECEQCENKFRIGIAQHKGQTFIKVFAAMPLEDD